MNKLSLLPFAALVLLVVQTASAQGMHEVPMAAYALVGTDDKGSINTCGMEVIGIHDVGGERRFFDTSLNFYASGKVLVKLTGKLGQVSNLDSMKPVDIYGGWFRAQGAQAVVPLGGKLIDGQTPKSKLFGTAPEPVSRLFEAILSGQSIQTAIEWKKGSKTVYFGPAQISEPHKQQLIECFGELQKAMEQEIPSAPAS